MHSVEGHCSKKAENDHLLCIPAIAKSQCKQCEGSSKPSGRDGFATLSLF